MILHLNGLAFKAHSPALLELLSVNRDTDPNARVFIGFTGTAWQIHYMAPPVDVVRFFPSRAAAIELIASRAQ